jgi:hypothetical protein
VLGEIFQATDLTSAYSSEKRADYFAQLFIFLAQPVDCLLATVRHLAVLCNLVSVPSLGIVFSVGHLLNSI